MHAKGVAGRWLSGVAVFADRDGARALELVQDESRRVRGVAICVAPLACDDTQATEALRVAWEVRGERRLLRRMARHGRTAAIDAFLDWLASEERLRDLVDDLPFGSAACVTKHLAHALERPSTRFWEGLALGHSAILVELLLDRWRATSGEGDPVTRQLTVKHHLRLAERVPERAFALAELVLERAIDPGALVWSELLRRRTEATVELAIRFATRLPPGVLANRARELPPVLLERIVANAPALLGAYGPTVRTMSPERQRALAEGWLASHERFPTEGAYLLRYLPAGAARDRAYERWSLAARDRDGVIVPALIAALPVELAAREARRHVVEVTALAIDPRRRLQGIARFLPWTELEAALADHLGHPEGEMRALALAELLANPGVYPDDTTLPARALNLVTARKFEQDPVRYAMLTTLAYWPRRVWRADHLPDVAQAIRDGLDASDLSVATAASAERLIVRLFGVDAKWAAMWLGTSIKERGALYDPNLGSKLSDADIRVAAPHLLAIARTWTTQERAMWLVAFATGLGPRMPLVDGLVDLLCTARDATPHEWIATQLTSVIALWDPARHAATLEKTLEKYRKRHWHSATIALAQSHGLVGRDRVRTRDRRRPTLPKPIAEALVEIARSLHKTWAPQAITVLRRRDPQTYDQLVAEIVDKDESFAILPDVHRWLHRHRQDQLAPYLEDRPIRGVYATGKTRWILPFTDGFFRWSPAQVERFATVLEGIVGDRDRDTPSVLAALTIWPEMEYAVMDRLCALADDDRAAIKEKAIRVLARCDAGQGVPTLLACLGDARARFAIYGLRRALFGMVPDRALALLDAAPMHKVTVAKEVVRLTGELRARGAFARLEQLARAKLHRDVRIALLRALWDHLDREPTWKIFEAAVGDTDWVVASRLADIPAERLTAALDTRLSELLARVIARPEPEARIGLLLRAAGTAVATGRNGRWLRIGGLALVDRERTLLAACRDRLRSMFDSEIGASVAALLARSTEHDMPAFGAALDALRADPRALHVAATNLCCHDIGTRASWKLAARELEQVAMRDPRWATLAVQASSARDAADEFVMTLDALGTLDHDTTLAARAALLALRDENLESVADQLATSPHPNVRRVAVSALEHDARPGRGWTPPRLARLAKLREDPSADVAGAAARLWPPREQDPR